MNSPSKHPGDSETDDAPPRAREQPAFGHSASLPVEKRMLSEQIGGGTFGDDPARLRRGLEPDVVPEPPTGLVDFWPIVLRLGAVGGIAGVVAGAVVLLFSGKSAVQESVRAKTPPSSIASTSSTLPPVQSPGIVVRRFAIENSRHASLPQVPPAEIPSASQPPPQVVATAPANHSLSNVEASSVPAGHSLGPRANPPTIAPSGEMSPPQARPEVLLDNDEIVRLIKRGRDLLNDGDFAAARLLFERAAQAGSADAATALGSTYDPLVIKRLGAVAVTPDLAKARKWYQFAADHGSAAALEPLANLERAR
jgi:hypothetical protein